MPTRIPKPCRHPGCPNSTTETYCPVHEKIENRRKLPCRHPACPELVPEGTNDGFCDEHKRPSAAKRGYGRPWRRASKEYLWRNPLCVECGNPAEVVDHKTAVEAGGEMWDESNWQSLCKRCHDKKTAKQDGAFGRKRKNVRNKAYRDPIL